MNSKEIDVLKLAITNMMQLGCTVNIPEYDVKGRIIGVRFKPYWTKPVDTKIERLEFNIVDESGRIKPFTLYDIIGYDILSYDVKSSGELESVNMDIHLLSTENVSQKEPFDKVRVELKQI